MYLPLFTLKILDGLLSSRFISLTISKTYLCQLLFLRGMLTYRKRTLVSCQGLLYLEYMRQRNKNKYIGKTLILLCNVYYWISILENMHVKGNKHVILVLLTYSIIAIHLVCNASQIHKHPNNIQTAFSMLKLYKI